MEQWLDVVGFEGYYVVSNMGRIMRVARGANGCKPGHIKTPCPNRCGYMGTMLARDGKNYPVRVHRVVAEAFIGPCPDGYEINHKNGNKEDNRADNLEWVTKSQNQRHRFDVLRQEATKGSAHRMSKLKEADIPEIRSMIADGVSVREIGRRFGVSGPLISQIKNGACWGHIK